MLLLGVTTSQEEKKWYRVHYIRVGNDLELRVVILFCAVQISGFRNGLVEAAYVGSC